MITASKANRRTLNVIENDNRTEDQLLRKQMLERIDDAIADGRFQVTIPIVKSEKAARVVPKFSLDLKAHGYHTSLSVGLQEYRLTINWQHV